VQRGPSEESLAEAFLSHTCTDAARTLRGLPPEQRPQIFPPELGRICEAIATDADPDLELLEAAVLKIDTPVQRARLAQAVIAQADAGLIGNRLAAAALVDLRSRSRLLVRASLVQAVAVRVGVARTPGGILLAA
jgi:hypothetical protein